MQFFQVSYVFEINSSAKRKEINVWKEVSSKFGVQLQSHREHLYSFNTVSVFQ